MAAGINALTALGRNRVLCCPLAGRPGHMSSVADTVRSDRDVDRDTWHCTERMDYIVNHYTFTI